MRILKQIKYLAPAAAIAAAGFFACSLQSCEKYVLPELSFKPDTLTFAPQGGTIPVELSANVIWSLSTGANWLDTDVLSGEGDELINVTAQPNSGRARKGNIAFKTETLNRSLIILQEGVEPVDQD